MVTEGATVYPPPCAVEAMLTAVTTPAVRTAVAVGADPLIES